MAAESLVILQLHRIVRHFREPVAVQWLVLLQLVLLLSQRVLLRKRQVHLLRFELVFL